MAYEVIWTDEAKDSFQSIIDYLLYKFTQKEVVKFILAVEAKISLIKTSPYSYRKSQHASNVHYTNVLRKTLLVYRIQEHTNLVELIHFWDARKNPALMNL